MSTEHDAAFGCELWTGKLDRNGYGYHGRTRAHIAAWEAEYGPVPEGFELDHLCRRRNCCALHHLEPVTRAENEMRKGWGYRVRRQTCSRGHDMKLQGVLTPEGGKVCRQCNREAMKQGPGVHGQGG